MDRHESMHLMEKALVGAMVTAHEPVLWRGHAVVHKYWGDIDPLNPPEPYEVVDGGWNLLMTQGANDLFTALIGGTITGGYYNNANANIGVGDSSTAASVGQTDLQAASNKVRAGMVATYPQVATNVLTLQSLFTTGVANFVWAEWAIFNAAAAGHMLNRAVAALGTKTSAAAWTLTVTVTAA